MPQNALVEIHPLPEYQLLSGSTEVSPHFLMYAHLGHTHTLIVDLFGLKSYVRKR